MQTYANSGGMLLRRAPMAMMKSSSFMKANQKMKASPKMVSGKLKAKSAKQTMGTVTRKPQPGPDRSKYGV